MSCLFGRNRVCLVRVVGVCLARGELMFVWLGQSCCLFG